MYKYDKWYHLIGKKYLMNIHNVIIRYLRREKKIIIKYKFERIYDMIRKKNM